MSILNIHFKYLRLDDYIQEGGLRMPNNRSWKKGLAIGIIILFIGVSIVPGIIGRYEKKSDTYLNCIREHNNKVYIDLVTRNIGHDDDITVYLGNGDGTFENRLDYYIGQEPRSIAAGDFNNDYKMKVVALFHDIGKSVTKRYSEKGCSNSSSPRRYSFRPCE